MTLLAPEKSSYTFKNRITHPNRLVSDKVNFFADVFELANLKYGKPGFIELENHRSLLEKIKFHLENYSLHSLGPIKTYFKNPYLTKNDFLIRSYYSTEWKKINKSKYNFIRKSSSTTKRNKLLREITQFIKRLDKTLFKNALNKIIYSIIDKEPLDRKNHIAVFQYYSHLLSSEFLFAGFPKKSLDEVFSQIFLSEVRLVNNKVETKVPLPKEVLKKKDNPAKFYKAITKYLKNRNLKEQFIGLFNLFKYSSSNKTFVFRLTNVYGVQQISLNYNGVIFSNQLRKKYVTKGKTAKKYREFFNGKGRLFVEVTSLENNEEIAKSNAILKANNALNYLNTYFNKEAGIEMDNYIFHDNNINERHRQITSYIHQSDCKKFDEDNSHEIFRNNRNSITSRFITLDPIYFQAKSDKRKDLKLTNYWRYVEAFFDEEGSKGEYVKKTVSEILSKNSTNELIFNQSDIAFQVLYAAYRYDEKPANWASDMNYTLNISTKELLALMEPGLTINTDLKKISELVKHPFISKKLLEFLKLTNEEKIELAYNHYLKVMTETYEQRNFIQHRGIYSDRAIDKILLSLPPMINDFRWLVGEKLKTKKYGDFKEVIKDLCENPIL